MCSRRTRRAIPLLAAISGKLIYFAIGVVTAIIAMGLTYVDHLLNWKHATSQKKVWSIPISNRGITRRSEVGSRIRLTLITVLLAAVSVGMFVWGLLAVEHSVRVWAN